MGKKSKDKGNRFERKVAGMLTEWWKRAGYEGEFYKTPASGGLRWQSRDDTIGDVCTPNGFTQTIECKNNESWGYKLFAITGKYSNSNLYGWWEQSCEEAERAGKLPWLILTKNYQPTIIIYTITDYNSSFQVDSLKPKFVRQSFFPIDKKYGKWCEVEYTTFDSFLQLASPSMFLEQG